MDNHPIPQDVTGFQFKLIGNMTVRQFVYLAAGTILAYIFVVLPVFFLIKIPLIIFSFFFGLSLAFLPIEGRPFDTVLSYFLKALFVPNQYVYQKVGGQLFLTGQVYKNKGDKEEKNVNPEKLNVFLQSLSKPKGSIPQNKFDEREMFLLKNIASVFSGKLQAPIIQEVAKKEEQNPLEEEKNKEALEKEALLLTRELEEAKKEEVLQQQTVPNPASHQKVLELEDELQKTLSQKKQLEEQLLALQKKLDVQKKVYSPGLATAVEETSHVRKIPKSMGTSVGLPIAPDAPNVITGIIKDPRGNVLPNILVEIKDKENNPVRAFKTNALGQFASATPLSNGVYTIEFEDPQGLNKFDTVEMQANGEIILPIEIMSTDEREELRKALFNT